MDLNEVRSAIKFYEKHIECQEPELEPLLSLAESVIEELPTKEEIFELIKQETINWKIPEEEFAFQYEHKVATAIHERLRGKR